MFSFDRFISKQNYLNKMAVDRKEANLKMLQDTHDVQDKTKEAVWRMNRQAAEAEQLGTHTLEELRRQGAQIVSYYFFPN
jgi:hypothetical protein